MGQYLETSDNIFESEQVVFPAGQRCGAQHLLHSCQHLTGSLHECIMNIYFQSRMAVIQHICLQTGKMKFNTYIEK